MVKKVRIVLGLILIIGGIYLYLSDLVLKRKTMLVEKNMVNYKLSNVVSYRYLDNNNSYNAILSIPKIGLKRGIYDIDNKKNNIDENIMIDKNSIYPNLDKSNIILIAHSGFGKKAFFKNLELLDDDSLIEFYYEHVKYVYKIDNYYYIRKTGYANLKYDDTKKTITLITCSSDNRQVIYIGYLIDKIEY